jgi:2-polyprenyl-6-hydroxyphenyl methylase / 3-demethylubiquinone-9 3-methyltransferase
VSDQLPRLGGLSEPEKYDRLMERLPGVWWDEAGPFVGLHELNVVRVAYFREVFGGFGGKRALDVGCGGGILAEALAAEGAEVTGIDPSAQSLAAAREHARRAGGAALAIDYRPGSAEDLRGAGLEGAFDLVFAVDVLEHVDDLDRTLAGVAAVLAPGGGLGFLTHNRTIAAFLQLVWDEEYVQHTMPEGFHDFKRFITPAELTEGLARNDMVVQEMRGVARAGDGGSRVLTDDLSVTYLGWALRTR